LNYGLKIVIILIENLYIGISSNLSKKSKGTNDYSWYTKTARGSDMEVTSFDIETSLRLTDPKESEQSTNISKNLLLYNKNNPKLIIPYVGLRLNIIVGLDHLIYQVTNFEYIDGFYTKIYCKIILFNFNKPDISNVRITNPTLTLILYDDKTGYLDSQDKNIHDSSRRYNGFVFTWNTLKSIVVSFRLSLNLINSS